MLDTHQRGLEKTACHNGNMNETDSEKTDLVTKTGVVIDHVVKVSDLVAEPAGFDVSVLTVAGLLVDIEGVYEERPLPPWLLNAEWTSCQVEPELPHVRE